MNCVNKNSPEFKELAKVANMNEIVLAAKVSIWQEKNGLDKFPGVEDITNGTVNIKPGVEELFEKDILLQLASNLVSPAIEELDNYLLDFLKEFNVKTKSFEELKSRLGVNALGATDVLNKLIWYVKNRNEETLPEESAHMLVALMGEKHPDIKELMSNITNWSEYNDIKNQYLPVYNDENKVKIEAVGKLIAKALVKNYKVNGLDKNKLQKTLDRILNYIKEILDSISFNNIFMYNEFVADHIAINVLSGNKDYIYKIKNLNPNLNAEEEINNNPNAKNIIETFSSNNVKMTGSLAIAETENIRRPKGQGIHDIDFKVKSFDVFNKEVFPKIPENAVPAHYGWHKKTYSTFAYLIPLPGYKIEVLERKDDFSNGLITKYKLFNEKNEEVKITQSNVVGVDFFVYKDGFTHKDFDFTSKFTPASLVYEGKISLGGKSNPYFFSRDKDQEDYVLRNPKSFIPFENHIYYQLPQNQGIKPGVEELFQENSELSNIGTPEQYSQYLDTIFPDSKVKDIVYHGTKGEKFDKFKPSEKGEFGKGVYFGNYQTALENTDITDDITLEPITGFDKNKIISAIINTQNTNIRDLGGNGTRNEYVVEPEQIHILGNKQDIEGFKEFTNGTVNIKPGVEELFEENPATKIYTSINKKC